MPFKTSHNSKLYEYLFRFTNQKSKPKPSSPNISTPSSSEFTTGSISPLRRMLESGVPNQKARWLPPFLHPGTFPSHLSSHQSEDSLRFLWWNSLYLCLFSLSLLLSLALFLFFSRCVASLSIGNWLNRVIDYARRTTI